MTRNAVAMTHVPFEDLGSLAGVLAERGFSVQSLDACTVPLDTLGSLTADLLVVMGGPIGAYETDVYPFLVAEIELIRRRVQAGLPTLGICLGAQLLAAALGAGVYPGQNAKEIGWAPISAGIDAASCPAMAELLAPGVAVLHWHGDTFDIPAGATHLALDCAVRQPGLRHRSSCPWGCSFTRKSTRWHWSVGMWGTPASLGPRASVSRSCARLPRGMRRRFRTLRGASGAAGWMAHSPALPGPDRARGISCNFPLSGQVLSVQTGSGVEDSMMSTKLELLPGIKARARRALLGGLLGVPGARAGHGG